VNPTGRGVGGSGAHREEAGEVATHRGPAADDPLASRLFPPLAGTVQWGLERTTRILAAVGHPLRTTPILHVGGTNGKGSVARIWAAILEAAGLRVGLYTSPDLLSFRERILVNGRPLPDAALERVAHELRPLFLREEPSYFEAATALALLALERARVEVAVVEVGLGGRFDATNVVSPVLTAITNVALEHREMLGDTLEAIAREKAGILKPGVPAYTSTREPEVLRVLREAAATLGAPLVHVPEPAGDVSLEGIRLSLPTRRWGRMELSSPLVGRHQLSNVALAVRALEALPPRIVLSAEQVREGLSRVRVPGRFQVEREGERLWVLDVAHNAASAEALESTLDRVAAPRPRVGVVAILRDKDHGAILARLAPGLDCFILTNPATIHPSRRWDAHQAVRALPDGTDILVEEELPRALEAAREAAGPAGTVVVTGSFRIVGETLRALERTPLESREPD
jgi:dihydrofolate synthase / folylpolyglutamate synthase